MISLKKLIFEAYPEFPDFSSLKDVTVTGIECDSRKVEPGYLFVAICGTQKDGHAFIQEALARGASAVVAEKNGEGTVNVPQVIVPEARLAASKISAAFYGQPSKKLKAVGITGTNGKTTASYLIEYFLAKQNKKAGVIGTVSHRYGGREILAAETTPGPLKLHKILSEMVTASCEYLVMEVSSHALDQDRTSGIDFESALFTNLTQDHLDYHKTMEDYFECKAKLFSNLRQDKFSVLNIDDPWGQKLKRRVSSRILSFGIKAAADLTVSDLKLELQSTRFKLARKISAEMPLIGAHNVYNALGALGVIHALGLDVQQAAGDLKLFPGVPGRLERVECAQDFTVFVDFAHTPDGLENVLRALLPYKKRKLILVFGCGGDRDRGKRPKMAAIAAEFADFVYVTSDNPRSEDPKLIAEEIAKGFPGSFRNYSVVIDRAKALRQALLSARQGDIVLLAGKGHERTQIIGDKVIPFSDRGEAEKVLHGH